MDVYDEFFLAYVDDFLLPTRSRAARDAIVNELKSSFNLRVSENVNLFLGAQLKWSNGNHGQVTSLILFQRQYVKGSLRRFGMKKCKKTVTPMVESFLNGLGGEENKLVVDTKLYQQMIGCLVYFGEQSRPGILVAVLILARY